VVKVTGAHNSRVSLAALICIKPGCQPRLIYRVHRHRASSRDRRKGFTETDYARLLDAAHQQLNPVEQVWSHLKRSLASLAKRNLAQLTALVKTRLRRMQYRPGLLDGFRASTHLDLTPFCNPRH
jgi:putative transposase